MVANPNLENEKEFSDWDRKHEKPVVLIQIS
jgi:hypothetical protein